MTAQHRDGLDVRLDPRPAARVRAGDDEDTRRHGVALPPGAGAGKRNEAPASRVSRYQFRRPAAELPAPSRESLAIRLTGAPKRGSRLRLPGSATLSGTIEDPEVVVPPKVKSVGNVLRAIGRAITGSQGPTAVDADCAARAARALR